MSYTALSKLHPNLQLLLKKISVIERIEMHALTAQIDSHRKKNMRLDTAIGIFCASYFAQASTPHGHEAARHGQGHESIKCISDSLTLNQPLFSTFCPLSSTNDYIMSSNSQNIHSISFNAR